MNNYFSKTYTLLISCSLIFLVAVPAFAAVNQTFELLSSWNPVGSGARALGMGGAFIAVADDATAASWNPGGLTQLELPEVSIVEGMTRRTESNFFGISPEGNGRSAITEENINYFSVVYPFSLFNKNMVISFNYQHLFDFNRKMNVYLEETTPSSSITRYVDQNNTGRLYAIGLAYAVRITPDVSLGLTLNFWEDWLGKNGWEEKIHDNQTLTINLPAPPGAVMVSPNISQKVSKYSFEGFNMNLGVMWNVSEKFTLGAVIKTPFEADLCKDFTRVLPVSAALHYEEDQEMEMPLSYGLGFAYRFADEFTISGDIYRTEWQNFLQKNATGDKTSPITSLSEDESNIVPTHQVRLGIEYLIIKPTYIVPIRSGIFYDPAPAMNEPDDYFGIAIGSGIAYGKIIFDIAYQFRYGDNVGSSIHRAFHFSQDVKEHTVYSSFVVHF